MGATGLFEALGLAEGVLPGDEALLFLAARPTPHPSRESGLMPKSKGQLGITVSTEPPQTSPSDIVAFFSGYPSVAIEIVSLYYPLPADWLRKYGDMLLWGGRDSFDYDSNDTTKTFYFWYPGIIFNKAITWTNEVRSIVAGALATRGQEFALEHWKWDDCGRDDHSSRGELSRNFEKTLRLVCRCPLSTDKLSIGHMGLLTYEAEPRVVPAIEQLTWTELMCRVSSESLPDLITNPGLWNNTLFRYFDENVVAALLKLLYWQHLHT